MDLIYDIETFKHAFLAEFKNAHGDEKWVFEVSHRVDQSVNFINFIRRLKETQSRGFGFNNEGFDYVVIHHLWETFHATGRFTSLDAYHKAQEIIQPKWHAVAEYLHSRCGYDLWTAHTAAQYLARKDVIVAQALQDVGLGVHLNEIMVIINARYDDRFSTMVWSDQRLFPQGDLFKIHHFDNFARSTSLKQLEIAMRSDKVIDLPYKPHDELTSKQIDDLLVYMDHDVNETGKFFRYSLDRIRFREELAKRYPDLGDVLNFNDTKIGKKYFELQLEKASPGICYTKGPTGRKTPRQTIRNMINLGDVISQKVSFNDPGFAAIKGRLESSTIVETKGVFEDMSTTVGGLEFIFGVGGIHGSRHKESVFSDDQVDIVDLDVSSYYPNLAISNRFYPEHLSDLFCDIYEEVYKMRKGYDKKSAENAMLKLALNGVYGDSGNKHGPFYDLKYMMSITVNGQLFLCMLAEWVMAVGARMIQANTDGITCMIAKSDRARFNDVCKKWEAHTGLDLESVEYSAMHIRDVNSYIAVKKDGSVKRIGAFAYETAMENPGTRELLWHKNQSMRVVAKAAEARLVRGENVSDFVKGHRDPFDFMKTLKVERSSRVEERAHDGSIKRIQNTGRYYVSTAGSAIVKVMPPLAKNPGVERPIGIEKGWRCKSCNDVRDFDWHDVNWLYYIEEAKKLTSWVK